MLLDTYLHSHVLAWGWVRWQCCDMPGLGQSFDSSVNMIKSYSFHFLPVLPLVSLKGYGIVSCNRFPGTHQIERPGWGFHGPGLKPVIRSGGMGVSSWDREGGHPLERAYRNLIPCYSRLWPPRLKVFLGRCLGWFLASWGEMGVY